MPIFTLSFFLSPIPPPLPLHLHSFIPRPRSFDSPLDLPHSPPAASAASAAAAAAAAAAAVTGLRSPDSVRRHHCEPRSSPLAGRKCARHCRTCHRCTAALLHGCTAARLHCSTFHCHTVHRCTAASSSATLLHSSTVPLPYCPLLTPARSSRTCDLMSHQR